MKIKATLLLLLTMLFPITGFSADMQSLLQQELDGYITELKNANNGGLADVGSRITSSGLSDKRLFDNVRDVLLSKHQAQLTRERSNKVVINEVVVLLRTLTSSGDASYMSIVNQILEESSNRAIRNRAKHMQKKIGFYNDRNRVMQDMSSHVEGQSLHTTRLLNLLKSDNLIMSRFGAEEIVRQGSADPVIQEWVANRLQEKVRKGGDKLQIDTLAWYCKVLGTVNKPKYFDFLTGIAEDKEVASKIRRHAKKILKS